MPRHRTPAERLTILREVGDLPTVAEQRAELRRRRVAWSTYVRWRMLVRVHGEAGLGDGRLGRPPTSDPRLDDLEARVARLETEILGT